MSRVGGAASQDRLATEPERRRRYGRFIGREEKQEEAEVLALLEVVFDDTSVCGAVDCVSRSSSLHLFISFFTHLGDGNHVIVRVCHVIFLKEMTQYLFWRQNLT